MRQARRAKAWRTQPQPNRDLRGQKEDAYPKNDGGTMNSPASNITTKEFDKVPSSTISFKVANCVLKEIKHNCSC